MRLHRFFVEQEIGDKKTIEIKEERLLYQWRNVLRFSSLDKVILFDGEGSDFLCEINILSKNEAKLFVLEKTRGIIPKRKITLFVSLIKRENFELVLEKTTELGVSHIIPVVADRSEKKSFNYERSAKIIVEASEQSGRSDIPVLGEEIRNIHFRYRFVFEMETICGNGERSNRIRVVYPAHMNRPDAHHPVLVLRAHVKRSKQYPCRSCGQNLFLHDHPLNVVNIVLE